MNNTPDYISPIFAIPAIIGLWSYVFIPKLAAMARARRSRPRYRRQGYTQGYTQGSN